MTTISVSGLGSGIDYSTWIDQLVGVKQAKINSISAQVSTKNSQISTLSTLKSGYSALLTAIEKFTDASFNSVDNIFTQKKVASSDEAITASVTSLANAQAVKVSVTKLATATVAKSASVAASAIDLTSKISDISQGAAKAGNFSIYKDGTKYSIAVDTSTTLGDLLTNITATTGLAATVSGDGKVTIGAGSSSTISIGSNADTSNMANVLSLVKNLNGSFTSSKPIFDTVTSSPLVGASFANGTVTAGKFTIGNAEFEVTASTTMDGLITQINNNQDSGVTAYWDANAGKLVLEANSAGAVNINIETPATGASNFTDVMGLTSTPRLNLGGEGVNAGSTDTVNGTPTIGTPIMSDVTGQTGNSILATGSQTLGENATLVINGTTITAASNTITSDISGVAGLTLNLKAVTTSTAKVTVENDSSGINTAISGLVSALNSVITQTNSQTSSSGNLYGESILSMLKNSIRQAASGKIDGLTTGYNVLSSIGITTGAIGSSATADTSQLVIDTAKLTAAIQSNPDAVMKLLVGDKTTSTDGVLTKLQKVMNNSLDPTNGYFVQREKSFNSQITDLQKTIDKQTIDLGKYRTQLETKFAYMDKYISNMKSQASVFDSYFNKSNSNSSSSSGN